MKLACVFPGQGSQSVGMISDLANAYPVVRDTLSSASAVLGYDLWQLVREGPEADLNRTDRTQPAMLAAGVAAWRVWRERSGPLPTYMAGHSLGEYTALVCAGALRFEDAVGLVANRARYRQEAVPPGQGAMAALLGLEDQQVVELCESVSHGEVLSAVNFNSPGQVVVAGSTTAVQRMVEAAKAKGAKRAVVLAVSVPAHSELMRPAAEQLGDRLEEVEISAPEIPVVQNVDVTAHHAPDAIRKALTAQLYSPVRWADTIRWMQGQGVDTLVECGPGKVLVGLNKRIDKGMAALPVHDVASLDKALAVTC